MESEDGDTIFTTCVTCHTILDQIEPVLADAEAPPPDLDDGRAFLHPDGDEEMTNQTLCSDCHDGGFHLYAKEEDEG